MQIFLHVLIADDTHKQLAMRNEKRKALAHVLTMRLLTKSQRTTKKRN